VSGPGEDPAALRAQGGDEAAPREPSPATATGGARRRLARARAALAGAGFDALVAGRPANLAYLSGGRRVVVRGSRPFAPVAVLVVGGGRLAVAGFSPGDDPTLGAADACYPQSWDPHRLARSLGALEGLAGARLIGVDGMTGFWQRQLEQLAPRAALADAEPVLRPLRTTRSEGELAWLRRPLEAAGASLEAACAALRPGAEERHVRAALAETAARFPGVSLVHEGWCRRIEGGRLARLAPGEQVAEGERLALEVAVVADGYEAGAGRSVRCPGGPGESGDEGRGRLEEEAAAGSGAALWARVRDAVAGACRPGVSGAELAAVAAGAGWLRGAMPLVHPMGFGPEPPLADDEVVAEGTVLVVQGLAGDAGGGEGGGAGVAYGRDMVLVRAGGGELLTSW
jgi:Xaa-Pro dipeptidase